jgi:hypothetical protein
MSTALFTTANDVNFIVEVFKIFLLGENVSVEMETTLSPSDNRNNKWIILNLKKKNVCLISDV